MYSDLLCKINITFDWNYYQDFWSAAYKMAVRKWYHYV